MTRALTFVTDASEIDVVPTIQNGNRLSHTIGLGAMGFTPSSLKIIWNTALKNH